MAKNVATNDVKVPKDDRRDVAMTNGAALAELSGELGDEQGLGVSTASDDNIVPFLKLLQDMNPEVKKRDDAYVEGAEPGCLLNTATRELWLPDPDTKFLHNVKGQRLLLQPCVFQRAVVEWIPRDMGGGRVATTPHTHPTIEETLKSVGGRQVPDPRDSSGRKMLWVNDSKHELRDTRYHFCNVVHDDGLVEPVIMSFSSTGHRTSQDLMTLMKNSRLPGGQRPHSWFKKYPVKAVTRSDNTNEWFVLQFEDGDWIMERAVRDAGRELYDSIHSGALRPAAEEPVEGSAGSAASDPI